MRIHDIFEHDIDRDINGVVKVGDVDEGLVVQELEEYVVTKELAHHFVTFFRNYEHSIDRPTGKIGVWISGFFGSGKSHFLKMLSYVLSNPMLGGKRAVDYFEGKIADPMVFATMKRVSAIPTETLLFNVDSKGGKWREGDTAKTALLRSFQRVFYENRGFYGEDLKLARLEAFIDEQGKTDEFHAAFERISGMGWLDNRDGWSFYEDDMVETLQEVLGMSRDAAQHWFDGTETDVISSETFAKEVAAYIAKREPECGGEFRLLFMADEIGQFIGSDSSLMLSMQTLTEDLGTYCGDKVWIVVTSQQAIDSVTSVVGMDFSKIQGRFNTRLSLSSSDVDEVIKERILAKTDEAKATLEVEYEQKATVLKNLFTFDDSTSDLFGYASENDFVESYPFVGYQFRILPDVFTRTREHGFSGKHMSSGERSMISAFQESVWPVEDNEIGVLIPFWRFYDTMETALDYGIRQVINRCQDAADEGHGLFQQDVHVIKALYLIRYIGDITPNVNNIANLMIDSMDIDKVELRREVRSSLERLVRENKAARNGDRYNFLTSEEQDVADEISKVQIESSEVIDRIKRLLFDGIFTSSKHRVGQNDFPFDRYIDDSIHGKDMGGMKLNVITYAHEWSRLADPEFAFKSTNQALIGLEEGDYYDLLDMSCRVEKYIHTNSASQWSASKKKIVTRKREEARENEKAARKSLEDAVAHARIAVDGRMVPVREKSASKVIETALNELVKSTYTKADCIDASVSSDSEIISVFRGEFLNQLDTDNNLPNYRAMDEVMLFLDAQAYTHQATNMGDLKRKYQKVPYGWREADIAAVIARMLHDQKVALSVGGKQLDSSDAHAIVAYLRRDADKASIKKREAIDPTTLAIVQRLMKDFADTNQVPADEDELVAFAKNKLREAQDECKDLLAQRYSRTAYPGKDIVADGQKLITNVLSNESDPLLLCMALANREVQEALIDFAEDMLEIRGFFNSQVRLWDESARLIDSLKTEGVYLEGDSEAQDAIERIKRILDMDKPYSAIKDLGALNSKLSSALSAAAGVKRDNLIKSIKDAVSALECYANDEARGFESAVAGVLSSVRQAAVAKKNVAMTEMRCSQLDAQLKQLETWSGQQYLKIDDAIAQARTREDAAKRGKVPLEGGKLPVKPVALKPKILHRSRVCPTKTMRSEEEVREYVDNLKNALLDALHENGAVRLGD